MKWVGLVVKKDNGKKPVETPECAPEKKPEPKKKT